MMGALPNEEEEKKEGFKKYNKKKHWSFNIEVQIPGKEEGLKFEIESSMKVKRLKEIIYEKIGGDIKPDRFKL